MEPSVRQHLHAVTLRTLHANQFNRTSSIAAHTITDLTQRYLTLLAFTAKEYSEHSGRDSAGINVHDVIGALGELGVGIEELMEFAQGDGKELKQYSLTAGAEDAATIAAMENPDEVALASTSAAARRLDSLTDIKSSLAEGKLEDPSDGVRLEYRRVPSPPLEVPSASTSRSQTPTLHDSSPSEPAIASVGSYKGKERAIESFDTEEETATAPHPTIVYPLSPISNPAYSPPGSPSRKRARHSSWSPPDHIPEFLPPFPGKVPDEVVKAATTTSSKPIEKGPTRRAPLPLRPTATSKSGYTKAISYNQSMLASQWDVPLESPAPTKPSIKRRKPPTSQGSASLQTLISAYYVLQTDTQPATNPSRLRVAHSLSSDSPARYAGPDTVYANTAPSPPRFAAPLPTHAVPSDPSIELSTPLPQPANNIVSDDLTAIDLRMPHVQPNLNKLAKTIIPPHLYSRITESAPPPALRPPAPSSSSEPAKPLLYHDPIPAPWNATDISAEELRRKDLSKKAGAGAASSKKLPDANLFATWDWPAKRPEEPLVARRGKLASYATSSSLGAATNVVQSPSPMLNGLQSPMPNGASGGSITLMPPAKPKKMVNGAARSPSITLRPATTPMSEDIKMEIPPTPTPTVEAASDIGSAPPITPAVTAN